MNNTKFKKRYIALIVPALVVAACDAGNTTKVNTQQNLSAFAVYNSPDITNIQSTKGFSGDFYHQAISVYGASTDEVTNGIQGADFICNYLVPIEHSYAFLNESAPHFAAFLVDGESRVACSTPNCSQGGNSEHINWVLQPNTNYNIKISTNPADGTNSISTNQYGLLSDAQESQVFGASSTLYYWTGLKTTYQSSATNCIKWTSPKSVDLGSLGDFSKNGNKANYLVGSLGLTSSTNLVRSCSAAAITAGGNHLIPNNYTPALICVEQPS